MKKTYTKPEISFDDFGIKSSFATFTCTYHPEGYSSDCGILIYGRTIFLTSTQGCQATVQDGDFGICYYVPSGANNVFGS